MSYWMKATLRERAGEMKWSLPPGVAGYYAIEVAGPEGTKLFHVGSSSNMQTNRFYQYHQWMKRQEVLSVRWKLSRKPFDWLIEGRKLKKFFEKRDRWISERQMKSNANYVSRTSKIFEAGEAKLAKVETKVTTKAKAINAGDELIKLLGGIK